VSYNPISLADLVPTTVAEMGARAARPDFDRWQAQAKGCGHPTARSHRYPHPRRPAGRGLQHRSGARRGRLHPLRQPPGGRVSVLLA
jgi:hypothetical protein